MSGKVGGTTSRRSRGAGPARGCGSSSSTALSPFARVLRVHDAGDFFSEMYLCAWLDVARERPETTFYWYTKCLSFWAAHLADIGTGREPGSVPNVVPTASWGGREDDLIRSYGLRSARVVFSEGEACDLGLGLDHDDSHAMGHGGDFGLLLHGSQPAGSDAAEALRDLRARGVHGYGPGRRPLTVL